jgi:hypothetical protein
VCHAHAKFSSLKWPNVKYRYAEAVADTERLTPEQDSIQMSCSGITGPGGKGPCRTVQEMKEGDTFAVENV